MGEAAEEAGGRLEGGWRRLEGVEEAAGGWGRVEEAGWRLEEAGRGQKLVKYESGEVHRSMGQG